MWVNTAEHNRLEGFSRSAGVFYTKYVSSGSTELFSQLFVYTNVVMLLQFEAT